MAIKMSEMLRPQKAPPKKIEQVTTLQVGILLFLSLCFFFPSPSVFEIDPPGVSFRGCLAGVVSSWIGWKMHTAQLPQDLQGPVAPGHFHQLKGVKGE